MSFHDDCSIDFLDISNHGRLYIKDLVLPHSLKICRNAVDKDFIETTLDDDDIDGTIIVVNHIPVAFIFYKLNKGAVEVVLVGNRNIKNLKHFRFGSFLLKHVEKYAKKMYADKIVVNSLSCAVEYYRKNGFQFVSTNEYFIYLTESVVQTLPDTYALQKQISSQGYFNFSFSNSLLSHSVCLLLSVGFPFILYNMLFPSF